MQSNTVLYANGSRYFFFSRFVPGAVMWSVLANNNGEWDIVAEDLTEAEADGLVKLLIGANNG